MKRAVTAVRRWTARLDTVTPPAGPLAQEEREALVALRNRIDALLEVGLPGPSDVPKPAGPGLPAAPRHQGAAQL